jgi:single-strand DNA-binding protein
MFNKILILGRLTKNPELTTSKDGQTQICSFHLAVNRKINGEDHATFFNCKCFKKVAELAGKFGKKGQLAFVEGELRQSKYFKDGQEKIWTEILVSSFYACSKELTPDQVVYVNKKSEEHNQEIIGNEFVDDNIPF